MLIENTQPLQNASYCGCMAPYLGWFGYGVYMADGGRLVGERVTIRDSHNSAIWVYGDVLWSMLLSC